MHTSIKLQITAFGSLKSWELQVKQNAIFRGKDFVLVGYKWSSMF